MTTYLSGFSLGLSLILAIGSQNAFVIKQGIKKQHVLAVCLVCAISDAILISLGVAGFGAVVKAYPEIETLARYGGAIFLLSYAFLSFRSAFTTRHAMDDAQGREHSLLKTIGICLAFTWLNPHVYLDTVVLLGSVSTQYQPHQAVFAAGAVSASFVFFFSLGFGARFLQPIFQSPRSWQILEFLVGVMMAALGVSLLI
ncbi:MAG: LysE/ArgO family amino acid transporter [Vibrio sp.]